MSVARAEPPSAARAPTRPAAWPRPRTLLFIVALFVWFNSGVEAWRRGEWGELKTNPKVMLWQPWKALRAFVSRGGDDQLYFEYAGLMLGRPGDLAYIASKELGDPQASLDRLRPRVRPGPGLRLPYRDFPIEYPPVPALLMLVPRLFVDTLPAYRVGLGACLGLLFLAVAWLGARLAAAAGGGGTPAEADRLWRRMGWLALAMGPLLCARFDLLIALLVAGALFALVQKRDALAGALFGVGLMTKLFPLLLLPPLLGFLLGRGERRRAVIVGASAAGATLLLAAPFLLTAPVPFLRAVALFGARPMHFESVVGAVVRTFQGPTAVLGGFGSFNVQSPPWLLRLTDLLLASAVGVLAGLAFRAGKRLRTADQPAQVRSLLHFMLAGVAVILCASKVLSPQYLMWLLPLAVVFGEGAPGRALFRVTLLATALTHVFFPYLYGRAVDGEMSGLWALLARNAVLVVLAVLAVRAAVASARPAPLSK